VVHALEERLQQLHKEKVGQLGSFPTPDADAAFYVIRTLMRKVSSVPSVGQNTKGVLFIAIVHTRAGFAVSQPGDRNECR
jgi:hypothetical protein